jgi:hypothetical protein
MKFETYMLRGLFTGCLLVCALIMTAMIEAKPQPAPTQQSQVAIAIQVDSLLTAAPQTCALPAIDLVCVHGVG